MKALTCEMCGSTDLIKQDGVFVCQQCGTKYSVEEARKMMVEGTVSIKGSVKVDNSDEINNLLVAARRAKTTGNYESAAKYYDQVTMKDPNNWESYFYSVYCNIINCKLKEIEVSCDMIKNSFNPTLDLIKEKFEETEQKEIVHTILSDLELLTNNYVAANDNFRSTLTLEEKIGTRDFAPSIMEVVPTFKKTCIEKFGASFEETVGKPENGQDIGLYGCSAYMVFLGSIFFCVLGAFIMDDDTFHVVIGWCCIIFFGGGLLYNMLTGKLHL